MRYKSAKSQSGFAHPLFLLFFVAVIAIVCFAGYSVVHKSKQTKSSGQQSHNITSADSNSDDPVTKGKSLSGGYCSGMGSKPLTHAPMDMKDVDNIQPMGLMVGGHVTPVDHEYYSPMGGNSSPVDAYPVYADADGTLAVVEYANDGTKIAWWATIAHSCTFLSNYNLMTSLAPDIKAKVKAGSGNNWGDRPNIAVKSGQLIGYVGHQTLDYQVWDTTKTLKGFLHPIAYNAGEAWKVNTVAPLDYFTADVKNQILPKYIRTIEPRDGKIDYDVSGQAVGNWFLEGSNGYAGGDQPGAPNYWKGHLSLTYYYLDPSGLVFSIGDYKGQPTQFAVKGVDWTKITPKSGVAKVELFQQNPVGSSGQFWTGTFDQGVKLKAGPTQATVLLQMTGTETMKVEVFPDKIPDQVNGFDNNAKTYNRGQDAHLVKSNTAT